ncbi:hypothetical protein ACIPC1_22105 [Streptomyces sp. NPDC087263]|uniref:hypothetical protein n=1 Tax=Streptomyces sp. NPDC087263 TaxID=3365773 RepID=UPI003825A0CE
MALELGVGVGVVAPVADSASPGGCAEEEPAEGVALDAGGVLGSDGEEEPLPLRASPTVVPLLSLKLWPATSSYVVMPAMVTPKTSTAAATGRFQLLTRAR